MCCKYQYTCNLKIQIVNMQDRLSHHFCMKNDNKSFITDPNSSVTITQILLQIFSLYM